MTTKIVDHQGSALTRPFPSWERPCFLVRSAWALFYPREKAGDRHFEGNSAAHLKASTVGTSQTVIIHNGKLLLSLYTFTKFKRLELKYFTLPVRQAHPIMQLCIAKSHLYVYLWNFIHRDTLFIIVLGGHIYSYLYCK